MSARREAFQQSSRELGYIEGRSIVIESRYAEAKRDRYPDLAGELVRLKVDIILVEKGGTVRSGLQQIRLDRSFFSLFKS